MFSLLCARSGEGAHAVLEETGEKREKRRREYSTTDDIIGALCLSRVILPAEVLLSLSLSLFRCTYLSFDTFHSFRLLDRTRAGFRIQENRMFDRTCRCNILRLQDQHSIVIL